MCLKEQNDKEELSLFIGRDDLEIRIYTESNFQENADSLAERIIGEIEVAAFYSYL